MNKPVRKKHKDEIAVLYIQSTMTTMKSTLLKSFNTLFFDFLGDIMTAYPENKEIKYANDKFELLRRGNPTIIIKFWKTYVYDPYREQLEAGDITFFIEKDYRSDFEQSNGGALIDSYSKILDMIESVRSTIRDMDEANRAHSANYVLNLSKLSEAYAQAA